MATPTFSRKVIRATTDALVAEGKDEHVIDLAADTMNAVNRNAEKIRTHATFVKAALDELVSQVDHRLHAWPAHVSSSIEELAAATAQREMHFQVLTAVVGPTRLAQALKDSTAELDADALARSLEK